MKRKLGFFPILGVVLMVLSAMIVAPAVLAGGMSAISVTLSSYAPDPATSNATIVFNPDGNINTDDGILLTLAGFDLATAVVAGDVAVTQTNTSTNITAGTAAIVLQDIQIPITTEGDTPSGQVTITISNDHLINPTAGTYAITMKTYDLGDDGAFGGIGANADTLKDSGSAAVVIGSNEVTITGTVDPTLTLALSANTCALGTLSTAGLKTCSYTSTVSTNAASGYTSSIKADGNLRNSTNSITNVSDSTVGVDNSGSVSTEEEYGISTSKSGASILQNDSGETCTNLANQLTTAMPASALTTSDQDFASSGAPIASDVTTLCHAAVIKGITPAGSYSQGVTITVVGNF